MLKKIINIMLAIVKHLAIAFFFATSIIIIVSPFVKDKIELAFSLVNNFATNGKIGEQQEIKFDSIKKKLANYPPYGTLWATLKIEDINLNEKIIHGDDLDLIKKNIGHYVGSYFPGEGGSIILAAHNSKKHFMYLPKLKINSEVIIKTDYGIFTYKVYKKKIIKATDEESLPIQSDKEILMMYTCYPVATIGYKSQRYVVYAELINTEYIGDKNEK